LPRSNASLAARSDVSLPTRTGKIIYGNNMTSRSGRTGRTFGIWSNVSICKLGLLVSLIELVKISYKNKKRAHPSDADIPKYFLGFNIPRNGRRVKEQENRDISQMVYTR